MTPAPAPPAAPRGPFEAYRRIFAAVAGAVARAAPDAFPRLDSFFERLPARQRPYFDGLTFDVAAGLDMPRLQGNLARAAGDPSLHRALALEALEALLAFALFDLQHVLPRPEAEALRREVARLHMGR